MDRKAFFWMVQEGRLPPPRAAETLGIKILKVCLLYTSDAADE